MMSIFAPDFQPLGNSELNVYLDRLAWRIESKRLEGMTEAERNGRVKRGQVT
jgi:hypothetical protein